MSRTFEAYFSWQKAQQTHIKHNTESIWTCLITAVTRDFLNQKNF